MATISITRCLQRGSAHSQQPARSPAQHARLLQRGRPPLRSRARRRDRDGWPAQATRAGPASHRPARARIWRSPGASRPKAKQRDHMQHELIHRVKKQNDLPGATPVATPTTRLPSMSKASRRTFSRTSRSLSVMRSAGWRVSGRWRTVPPDLNGTVHASAACAWARRPAEDRGSRFPAWRALCLDESFYLHRQGQPGSRPRSCPPQCRAGARVRTSQPRVSRPCQLRLFVAQN